MLKRVACALPRNNPVLFIAFDCFSDSERFRIVLRHAQLLQRALDMSEGSLKGLTINWRDRQLPDLQQGNSLAKTTGLYQSFPLSGLGNVECHLVSKALRSVVKCQIDRFLSTKFPKVTRQEAGKRFQINIIIRWYIPGYSQNVTTGFHRDNYKGFNDEKFRVDYSLITPMHTGKVFTSTKLVIKRMPKDDIEDDLLKLNQEREIKRGKVTGAEDQVAVYKDGQTVALDNQETIHNAIMTTSCKYALTPPFSEKYREVALVQIMDTQQGVGTVRQLSL